MATQTLNTPAQRVGIIKGEILAHAIPVEVLALGVTQKKMPKNGGETIVYRRWLPFGATTASALSANTWTVASLAHLTQEGVTPAADTLVPQDVTVNMQQYACLYSVTDKLMDLSEDGVEIPMEMKKQTGERMGLVREMVRYGVLKACTNKFFAGGTSRATMDETVTLNFLRKITKSLKANHAKVITSILSAAPGFNTTPVEAAYIVFAHTNLEADIRNLPGFKETAVYGQRKVISEYEIGSCENFRFILSPELASIPDAGAAIAGTGLFSTTGTLADVYPMLVMAEEAACDVALRGKDALDPTWIPPGQKDKNDPLGQRGYIGAKFYAAAFVANNGWMAAAEVGETAL